MAQQKLSRRAPGADRLPRQWLVRLVKWRAAGFIHEVRFHFSGLSHRSDLAAARSVHRECAGALKDRMPYVVEGRKGLQWVAKNGAKFGLMNGMGSAGREYVPGEIHRSDRMASTGLYDDGRKGIRRLTHPAIS